jgi:hypothetical protein
MRMRAIILILSAVLLLGVAALAQEEPMAEDSTLTVETQLCTGIEELMPVGMADVFPADVGKVYLWTKVIGSPDTTMIKHVWFYKGDEIAEVDLPVKSPSWRTYSFKTIPPDWTGDWVVKVVDAQGNILKAVPFKVGMKQPEAKPVEQQKTMEEKKKEEMESKPPTPSTGNKKEG